MNKALRGYKLCKECGQPILKKGQVRKHPDEYRHARGCSLDDMPNSYSLQELMDEACKRSQTGGIKDANAVKLHTKRQRQLITLRELLDIIVAVQRRVIADPSDRAALAARLHSFNEETKGDIEL